MKKLIITLLCLAIVSGGSYGGYKQYKKNKDAKRIVDVVPVSLLKEEGFYDEEESMLSAEVTSGNVQRVNVSNQSMIKEVKVQPGQEVKKGDILIVYDTTLVELETEQKKNRINVLERELANEEKELERLKKLLPSESKPRELPEPDDEDYYPDDYEAEQEEESYPDNEFDTDGESRTDDSSKKGESSHSDSSSKTDHSSKSESSSAVDSSSSEPDIPKADTLAELTDPEIGAVQNNGIYEFNCTFDSAVTQEFMLKAAELKIHIIIKVYDENGRLCYCWELDFSDDVSASRINNVAWAAGDGVTVKDGRVSYNGSNPSGAVFYIEAPASEGQTASDSSSEADDSDLDNEQDDADIYDDGDGDDNEFDDSDADDEDMEDDGGEDAEYDNEYDGEDDYEPSYDYYDDDDGDDTESENYVYTRAELAIKIKEQEMDIKSKKLDIKAAELDYKNSKKRKDSGVEVAQIDGIVMKVGDQSFFPEPADDDEYWDDDEFWDDDEYWDEEDIEDYDLYDEMVYRQPIEELFVNVDYEDDFYDEDIDDEFMDDDTDYGGYDFDDFDDYGYDDEYGYSDANESAYLVIQGSANVSVDISVGELNLSKFPVGTEVYGISYDTNETFSAIVTGVKDQPASYYSESYNENPNSSTYIVTADVTDTTNMSVGSWVSINMPQDDEHYYDDTSSWYIPMQYCRKEGNGYYVMKADKDGRLEKQTIETGKTLWGYYIEIKGGLDEEDKICFPYGKDVKVGVRTKETDEVEY